MTVEAIWRHVCGQVLYERLNYQVGNRGSSPSAGSEAEPSVLSARSAINHTRDILQSTNRATRLALSHVSDAAWWRRTLGNLHPTQPAAGDQHDDRNVDLQRAGCHPFYESLHVDCYVNKVVALSLK